MPTSGEAADGAAARRSLSAWDEWYARLEAWRVRLKLTQAEFARERLDCTAAEYSRFLRRTRRMSQRVIQTVLVAHPEWAKIYQRAVREELLGPAPLPPGRAAGAEPRPARARSGPVPDG